ncbi:MAG: sulfurtransferase [Halanaerobium sp.]
MKFNLKKILLVLLVIVVAGAGYFIWMSTTTDVEIDEDDYVAIEDRGYENPEALISAEELNEIKDQDDVVVLDFRREDQYLLGHIPGALQLWRPDVSDDDHEYDGMRISRQGLANWLGDNGISPDDTVVIYTEGGGHDAARMWWLMERLGHEDIRLLDGGIDYWRAADYDTELSPNNREAVDYEFEDEDINEDLLASVEDVRDAVDDQDTIILDTRSKEEHTGEKTESGAARAGRIPSRHYLEWNEAVDEQNLLKSTDELEEMYEEEGVNDDKAVIPYCQSGVRSAHTTFVLTQLLGYDDVKNYDGSWIEWSHRDDLEIETGESS